MGHGDPVGPSALALHDLVDHPPDEQGHQVVRRVLDAVDDDRREVADLPLELPHHPIRLADHAALGRLADEHRAVR